MHKLCITCQGSHITPLTSTEVMILIHQSPPPEPILSSSHCFSLAAIIMIFTLVGRRKKSLTPF